MDFFGISKCSPASRKTNLHASYKWVSWVVITPDGVHAFEYASDFKNTGRIKTGIVSAVNNSQDEIAVTLSFYVISFASILSPFAGLLDN